MMIECQEMISFAVGDLCIGTQLDEQEYIIFWWRPFEHAAQERHRAASSLNTDMQLGFRCSDKKEKYQITLCHKSDVLFLSKCNLRERQREREINSLKKHKLYHLQSCFLADLRSVVMYLQWNSLSGKMQREVILEQRKQIPLPSSSLSSQGLRRFQVNTKQENNQMQSSLHWLWTCSWVSSRCAGPRSAVSCLLLQIVAKLGNL